MMKRTISAIAGIVLMVTPAQDDCVRRPDGNFRVAVWRAATAFGFEMKELAMVADGTPDSYRVDGRGLS